MEPTLGWLQPLLNDVTFFVQLVFAIIGLLAIIKPVIQTSPLYNDIVYTIYGSFQAALQGCFKVLGIQKLIAMTRPYEYYNDLTRLDIDYTWQAMEFDKQDALVCVKPANGAEDTSAVVSGLVNTGNSCFLNSVLQALSSLPTLHVYLTQRSQTAVACIPLPVTRSLLKTMRQLSKPLYWRSSFRPTEIVATMPSNRRVINREQQDAHEVFQLLSSAIEAETQRMEQCELGGLQHVLAETIYPNIVNAKLFPMAPKPPKCPPVVKEIGHSENPLSGLLANRLSCMHCGYTEAIRHFPFNNIQLNLPNTIFTLGQYTTTLYECLQQFTSMEFLKDVTCRKCTLVSTVQAISLDIKKLSEKAALTEKPKSTRKTIKRIAKLEKIREEIKTRLNQSRIEEETDDVELWGKSSDKTPILRATHRLSSKQAMIAKPPKILCLHVSRSAFHESGALYKNLCQLSFPEYLNMALYCTNGTLHTTPNVPISTFSPENDTCKYRLMSVIVHYGNHSYGHFVTYKRRLVANICRCNECGAEEEKWDGKNQWYRVSDTKVDVCSIDTVLQANPYMLLYEKIEEKARQIQHLIPVKTTPVDKHQKLLDTPTIYYGAATSDTTLEALRISNALLMNDKHGSLDPSRDSHSWTKDQSMAHLVTF
ncbi:hypothetical protein CLU79DRAFT_846397 [Phycomyces nitens]|nr:hypothetical protein CLU79DRAFT_846397 [Phycomyces nitens]